jgi:hypothetical protein
MEAGIYAHVHVLLPVIQDMNLGDLVMVLLLLQQVLRGLRGKGGGKEGERRGKGPAPPGGGWPGA